MLIWLAINTDFSLRASCVRANASLVDNSLPTRSRFFHEVMLRADIFGSSHQARSSAPIASFKANAQPCLTQAVSYAPLAMATLTIPSRYAAHMSDEQE